MKQKQATCILKALNPILTQKSGALSLYYKGQRVWVLTKSTQNERRIEVNTKLHVSRNEWVQLELYLNKWFFIRRKVGEFFFFPNDHGRNFNTDISKSDSRSFNLEWELI